MEYGLYHGCGNSFYIGFYNDNIDYKALSKKICNNVDGLILLKENPLTMLIYNADGSIATMCGNGLRCFAKFVYDLNIVKDLKFNVKTLAGNIEVEIKSTNPFISSINLGKPNYSTSKLGIDVPLDELINYQYDENIIVSAVFLGTDHLVLIDYEDYEIAEKIARSTIFTKGINVNFVKVKSKEKIYVKTYERGVGWTKACGTGASSSFCICNRLGLIGPKVEVEVDGGKLLVYKDNENIILEGPAVTIKEPLL
ncbi:MAG TPA: diaminopimelate epimerase [Acholeplasmataceae bacterium]|nr:diaminopimelate epimerase [Acholeplasmataceae bacterium]